MDQKDCLQNYQGRSSSQINRCLRNKKTNQNCLEIEHCVNESLSSLEMISSATVYRVEQGINDFDKVKDWFQERIGQVIQFPAFTSCSDNRDWMVNRELVFEISTSINSRSHSLLKLNETHPEREVLFKSKTNFTIIAINESLKTIYLEETDTVPNEIIYEGEGFFQDQLDRSDSDSEPSLSDSGII